jgi:hypothetical protein
LKFVSWCNFRSSLLLGAASLCLASALFHLPGTANAGAAQENRKSPMKFRWVDCQPNCRGWVSAVGVVTADTPKDFEDFARGRQLGGATIVLDSSGGSVNDAITLGRRFRGLAAMTTVGTTHSPQGHRVRVAPEGFCESMCVYLLLSGTTRYVPPAAHVRVHQIWMGDRADDAKAASYTAQDLTIVERDIGRLAKYTFDMGGAGDLLALSLNVPPWEDLHELTPAELRLTNLVTTDQVADVLPRGDSSGTEAVAALKTKAAQDRFVSTEARSDAPAALSKTAEATVPTAAVAPLQAGRKHGSQSASAPSGRRGAEPSVLRSCGLAFFGFYLADRVYHGVKRQHGRGVARLEVANRLKKRDIGPFSVGRSAIFLQHLAHCFPQLA